MYYLYYLYIALDNIKVKKQAGISHHTIISNRIYCWFYDIKLILFCKIKKRLITLIKMNLTTLNTIVFIKLSYYLPKLI